MQEVTGSIPVTSTSNKMGSDSIFCGLQGERVQKFESDPIFWVVLKRLVPIV